MPSQLKFQQFLNVIVIGVLFELLIIIFVNNIPELLKELPFSSFQFLHKDNATLTIMIGIIFSFPSWRIVSSFVGYLMEPVKNYDAKGLKRLYCFLRMLYSLIFYGVTELEEEVRLSLLKNLCKENASYLEKRCKYEIETLFSIDLKTVARNSNDTYRLFEMINAYIYRSKTLYEPYQTDRLYTNHNFHARMAILCNFAFLASMICLVASYFPNTTLHNSNTYALCSVIFFILCRFWGKMFDDSGVGYQAALTDFMTSFIAEENNNKKK